ncbi:hypothetical protein BZG01_12710 [Labilibaculum manganireducens]|uniref:Glycosyl hydrolase family 43 n=1 Tax=Labilibaculum manganireducens TaxID=1940525 RepID=A0A2N3I6R3_9BACT|nr:family 43 glycosylhydrolase [Labilibaculum manganireducens]PKQ66012.1 hypothetical protein BZG01_12710 [Labilibaculum manganireducens]
MKINYKKERELFPVVAGLILACCVIFSACSTKNNRELIEPGKLWPDKDGNHIQAHGGGVIKIKNTYFWYGEQRSQGLDPNYRYVSCYSSKDLMNWKFRGNVLKMTAPDSLASNWVLERPKVFYNEKTGKCVMYFHIDVNYGIANMGMAVSDSPTSEFKYIKRFRPMGHESRDISQFIDNDGSAYLIYEDRKIWGTRIVKLSDDYMELEKEVSVLEYVKMEGGGIFHKDGLYYLVGSRLTGWNPNPNVYATAPSLEGPWSKLNGIAPKEVKTYGSQTTMLLTVAGTKDTTVIFLGDIWRPENQHTSTYLWMPLKVGDGKLWLPEPQPWKINVKTGVVDYK